MGGGVTVLVFALFNPTNYGFGGKVARKFYLFILKERLFLFKDL